jgi:transcriptional regulator with PAS, ATPase and Fis domain
MPLKLQSRLLRVIEQREVMRIGGDSVINIDVRIIAATNNKLKRMVNLGEFREDLYYRLSVLPLKIPPLRERKEDIRVLIDKIKEELQAHFQLSREVIDLFMDHNWQGNVRELRNYLEFFANLKKRKINIEDLPFTFKENEPKTSLLNEEEKETLKILEKRLSFDQLKNYIFVLQKLKEKNKKGEASGRRSLAKEAAKNNIFLSEQEIRKIFKDLQGYKLVNVKRGRSGSKITDKGINILPVLKNKID